MVHMQGDGASALEASPRDERGCSPAVQFALMRPKVTFTEFTKTCPSASSRYVLAPHESVANGRSYRSRSGSRQRNRKRGNDNKSYGPNNSSAQGTLSRNASSKHDVQSDRLGPRSGRDRQSARPAP